MSISQMTSLVSREVVTMLGAYLFLAVLVVTAADKVVKVKLNDGREMPAIALGTYLGLDQYGIVKPENKQVREAILSAIDVGYRHIDTASLYGTEEEIGEAIKMKIESGDVKRSDMFITTKLWNTDHKREQVSQAIKESLKKLQMDYIDLYLMHFPIGLNEDYTFSDVDFIETWLGLEDVLKQGLAKSIGISNFNQTQIERLLQEGSVKPAVLQIEVHPTLIQKNLVEYAQEKGIVVMAYSPLGPLVSRFGMQLPGLKIDDPVLMEIANKHNKTTPQVVLRWLVDRNIVPVVKSLNAKRQAENINIFDFKLTEEEIKKINAFNSNTRIFLTSFWQNHLYYPFEKIDNPIPDPFVKTN